MKLFPCSFFIVFTLMASWGSPSDEVRRHRCPQHWGPLTQRAVFDFILCVFKSVERVTISFFMGCFDVCFEVVYHFGDCGAGV